MGRSHDCSTIPDAPQAGDAAIRIASWNVNSLKVRLPHLQSWICAQRPDIVALQETKLTDENFPVDALEALGYHAVYSGQKTYNGVAILSREPAQDVTAGIPGFQDDQKRVLAATIGGLRVVDLYVVNGQEVGSEKFGYKLRWLAAVREWLREEIARHPRLVVLGDFNIAPEDRDVHDPKRWREKILCSTPEREALQHLLGLGLHDSLRLHSDAGGQYSWWDYRLAAYQRGWGLRIDLVLLGEALCAACSGAGIDIVPREWERPSDHAPVWVELDA